MINHKTNYSLINKLKNPQPVQDLNVYTYNEKKDSNGKIIWAQIGVVEKAEKLEGITLKPGWIE